MQVYLEVDTRKHQERSEEMRWEEEEGSAGSKIKRAPALGNQGSFPCGAPGNGAD